MHPNLLWPHTVLAHPSNDRPGGIVTAQVVRKRESSHHAETECIDSAYARSRPRPSIGWGLHVVDPKVHSAVLLSRQLASLQATRMECSDASDISPDTREPFVRLSLGCSASLRAIGSRDSPSVDTQNQSNHHTHSESCLPRVRRTPTAASEPGRSAGAQTTPPTIEQ